jgi:hypothetical protein
MIHVKRFIDKISSIEGRTGKLDIVLPINEARGLRDELTKMLADNYELLTHQAPTVAPITHIELLGSKF